MSRLAVIIAVSICLAVPAGAHLRDYLVTQPYWTLPRGSFEIEVYNDFKRTETGDTTYVHQTELEYGLTGRLTLGVYAVMEKEGAEPLSYAGTKFEGRYRLAEPGRLPVDPALYFEYKRGARGHADAVEWKLLLSKDFAEGWNATANLIAEREREPGARWEKGYTMGVSRWLTPRATVGIEIKGEEDETQLIPGVYLTPAPNMRFNIGAGFVVAGDANDFTIKTLMEFEF